MIDNQLQMSADEQRRIETFDHTGMLLESRGSRYGVFKDTAGISQSLKAVMRRSPNWEVLDLDMKEALEMSALKISRILGGDPKHDDSWLDIAGYATLVADRLRK